MHMSTILIFLLCFEIQIKEERESKLLIYHDKHKSREIKERSKNKWTVTETLTPMGASINSTLILKLPNQNPQESAQSVC
jgi:hypothetical protein